MTNRTTILAGLLSCAFLYGAGTAAAVEQATLRAPDARALGLTEAYRLYCFKFDPAAASQLQARVDRMIEGDSADVLAGVRAAAAYRTAFDSVTDFVAKVDARNAAKPCAEALAKNW